MDDTRIDQIRNDVLQQLRGTPSGPASSALEARVAALEAALGSLVARLGSGSVAPPPGPVLVPRGGHPGLQLLAFPGASPEQCVLEPDKPCVKSHACKVYGY